jgi:proline iminopeptidase
MSFTRIIFFFLICAACSKDTFHQGDFFFLVNKQAQMPVIVRGNKASGVFILFVHGGPGGTAIQKIGLPAFNELEKSYATVFWDQRSSGSSQGNSDDKYLTLDQFVEDLDKLIDLIRYKYHQPEIFLLGHSWGGCLGTAYLTDPQRQNKIRGWIEVDGAHNNPKGDSLSLQWITDYAARQIGVRHDADVWNYALKWYKQNPNFTSDQMEHYSFLEKAHAYIYDPNVKRDPKVFPEYSFDYVFESPADVTAALTNYQYVIKKFVISDIDLTPQMSLITIPSLIIWGKQDGVIPFPMAEHAYRSLGTADADKDIVTLEHSGHFGYYEEPTEFTNAVSAFVERFR